jgi:hypothetical protein
MLFAILPANLAAQEHDGRRLSAHGGLENRLGRHYSRFWRFGAWRSLPLNDLPGEIPERRVESAKLG